MKIVKIIAGIVGAVVIILLGLGIYVTQAFNPNDFRKDITTQVKAQTGRTLTIDGDISLSFFPYVGIQIGKTSFSNPEGYTDAVFASMDKIDINVAVMPLIQKKLAIDELQLHGLNVALEKNKQGVGNWEVLIQKNKDAVADAKKTDAHASKKTKKTTGGGQSSQALDLSSINIGGINIKDANISWSDQQAGLQTKLEHINLTIGELSADKPVDFKLTTKIQNNQPQAELAVLLKATITFDASSQRIHIDDGHFSTELNSSELPTKHAVLAVNSTIDLDLQNKKFALPNFTISLKASGKDLPGESIDLTLGTNINADLIKQLITIKDLKMKAADQFNLDASATIGIGEKPNVDFKLAIDAINADSFIVTAGKQQKTDETATKAEEKVASAAAEKDVSAETTTDTKSATPVQKIELPIELLRSLSINGLITIGKITAAKNEFTDFKATIDAKNGLLKVSSLSLKALDGIIKSSASLNVQSQTPQYKADVVISKLNLGSALTPIVQQLTLPGAQDWRITGSVFDVNLDLKTAAQTVLGLKKNLSGKIQINSGKTEIMGLDFYGYTVDLIVAYAEKHGGVIGNALLAKEIAKWRQDYKKKDRTVIDIIRANSIITDGILNNDDFLIQGPDLKISGSGKVMIAQDATDYRTIIDLELPGKKSLLEQALDLPLPLDHKGPYGTPPKPDFTNIKKLLATSGTDQLIDKAFKGDPKKKAIGDALKRLFK